MLATVFSVQQGAYGPLVVYKLQIPKEVAKTLGRVAPAVPEATPAPRKPGPLKPTILGTVVMPAKRRAAEVPLKVPDAVPVWNSSYRIVSEDFADQPMINQDTGQALTLQDVHKLLLWRRDTTKRLHLIPPAPRF